MADNPEVASSDVPQPPATAIEPLPELETVTAGDDLTPHFEAWTAMLAAAGGLAARVAVRRHARPSVPGAQPRPLSEVGLLVGSGVVLRAAVARAGGSRSAVIDAVLARVLADRAGGWALPHAARPVVDGRYVLAAAGCSSATTLTGRPRSCGTCWAGSLSRCRAWRP